MGTEINWFEIYVTDLERAEAFYKKIFNATFFDMKDYPHEAKGITLKYERTGGQRLLGRP